MNNASARFAVYMPMSRPVFFAVAALISAPILASAQQPDTLRLSLQDAVTIALRASDEVRLSAMQAEIADAQLGTARASALPQLRVTTGYTHGWENARGNAVGQVFNQPNTYTANLNLSQTLFQGGRIFAGIRSAGDVRSAAELDEKEVRSRTTVDVQRAYLQVLFTERMQTIQQQNFTLAASRAQQIEQLQTAGRAARYDVVRAHVERGNIEPLVVQAQNDRAIAELDLKRLLNIPVDQPLSLTTNIDAGGLRMTLASLEDSTAQPDRASLRSAELILAARRQGVSVARADLLPTATISFQSGYQAFPPLGTGFPIQRGVAANEFCAPGASPTQRCQNGGWFADRSMTATISLPLFDGLRARSNIGLARAQQRLAEIQLQQQRETVGLEVARARAELKRARSVFDARKQNASEAEEAFQLASLRFNRGLSTQLEVSDAQFALLTAQSTEARATFDLFLASAELARALGRPIPFPPTTSTTRSSDSGNGTPRDE
jgi:outer membrane protein TolC